MPELNGCRPLNTAARDGQHSGAAHCAFEKITPRAARRSMLGVRVCGCPFRKPTQSFKSSTAMNRMFGRSVSAAWTQVALKRTSSRKELICFMWRESDETQQEAKETGKRRRGGLPGLQNGRRRVQSLENTRCESGQCAWRPLSK